MSIDGASGGVEVDTDQSIVAGGGVVNLLHPPEAIAGDGGGSVIWESDGPAHTVPQVMDDSACKHSNNLDEEGIHTACLPSGERWWMGNHKRKLCIESGWKYS